MAITTSAGAGVQITSAAAHETLGTQAQANGIDEIIFSDDISTLGNGDLASSPTYAGRIILIRYRTQREEFRYAVSDIAGTGNTRIVKVSEPWTIQPASSDDVAVSYIIQDAATVTGFNLINKRVNDYDSSRKFKVNQDGSANGYGFFAILDGASLETVDNDSTSEGDIDIVSNPASDLFFIGYQNIGESVSGGAIFGTPAEPGERVFEGQGRIFLYDTYFKCVENNNFYTNVGGQGISRIKRCKFFSASYNSRFDIAHGFFTNGPIKKFLIENVSWEGLSTINDTLLIGPYVEIDDLLLINTNGLLISTLSGDGVPEPYIIKNFTPITNLRMLRGAGTSTGIISLVKFINPNWTPIITSQKDLELRTSEDEVEEIFTLDISASDTGGNAVDNAHIYVQELDTQNDLIHENVSNPTGDLSFDIIKRRFTNNEDTDIGPDAGTGFDFNDADPDTIDRNDGGSWITDGIAVNDTIRVSAATTSANNGTYLVTAVTASVLTLAAHHELTADTGDNTATFNRVDLAVELRDNFILKAYKYGFVPALKTINPNEPLVESLAFGPDSAITETDQATAVSNGSGIVVERHGPGETDIRPVKVLAFDTGSNPIPEVGDTIQGQTSGGEGDVFEIIGDNVSGLLVLENWNGTEFDNNETLDDIEAGETWTATSDTGVKATANMDVVTQAELVDAETFTLVDNANLSWIFEFDVTGDGVSGSNILVDVSNASTATEVRDVIIAAINNSSKFTSALVDADSLTITQLEPGTSGNRTNSETVTDADFVLANFTSGADGNGVYEEYTWLVDGSDEASTVIYDFLAAKISQASRPQVNNVFGYTHGTDAGSLILRDYEVDRGVNRVLVVIAGGFDTTTASHTLPTGVTWGGSSLTEADNDSALDVDALGLGIWYLTNPPRETRDITITYGNGNNTLQMAIAFYVSNVEVQAPEATNSVNTTSEPVTTSVTTVTDDALVVDGFLNGLATTNIPTAIVTETGQERIASFFGTPTNIVVNQLGASQKIAGSSGSTDMGWNVFSEFDLAIHVLTAWEKEADNLEAVQRQVILWGEGEQSQLYYLGADGYFTERNINLTEGVWVANRGAGIINYMTSDSGRRVTPPQAFSLTLTGLQPNTEVRIYDVATETEQGGVENSGTTFVYNYTYSGSDIDIFIIIHHINYVWQQIEGVTLSNANQSIPVQQQFDRVYENPP